MLGTLAQSPRWVCVRDETGIVHDEGTHRDMMQIRGRLSSLPFLVPAIDSYIL